MKEGNEEIMEEKIQIKYWFHIGIPTLLSMDEFM